LDARNRRISPVGARSGEGLFSETDSGRSVLDDPADASNSLLGSDRMNSPLPAIHPGSGRHVQTWPGQRPQDAGCSHDCPVRQDIACHRPRRRLPDGPPCAWNYGRPALGDHFSGACPMSTSIQLALILPAMTRVDLNEDQRELLVHALRDIIAADRFPPSPRIRCLREILAKIEHQPAPAVEPFPPPRPPGEPSRLWATGDDRLAG
jgi:hypothetical protein